MHYCTAEKEENKKKYGQCSFVTSYFCIVYKVYYIKSVFILFYWYFIRLGSYNFRVQLLKSSESSQSSDCGKKLLVNLNNLQLS